MKKVKNKLKEEFDEVFIENFQKIVEKDTWENGLPMIYMDENGWMVKHYKDGVIEKVKKLK